MILKVKDLLMFMTTRGFYQAINKLSLIKVTFNKSFLFHFIKHFPCEPNSGEDKEVIFNIYFRKIYLIQYK